MSDDPKKDKALRAAAIRSSKRLTRIQRDTDKEIRRLLKQALEQIRTDLALSPDPKSWQTFHLTRLQKSVRDALDRVEREGAARLGTAAGESWQAGIGMVDGSIATGFNATGGGPRFNLAAQLGEIDTRQLRAMRAFMTDRMSDISTTVANRINSELGLVLIGGKTQHQAADAIGGWIEGCNLAELDVLFLPRHHPRRGAANRKGQSKSRFKTRSPSRSSGCGPC